MRIVVALATLALLLPVAFASGSRSETRSYVAGVENLGPTCLPGLSTTPGGACFAIRTGETSVVLDVQDAGGHPWLYYDVSPLVGAALAHGVVCDTTSPVEIALPQGSLMIKVYIGEWEGPILCPLGPTPGTMGTITATFS